MPLIKRTIADRNITACAAINKDRLKVVGTIDLFVLLAIVALGFLMRIYSFINTPVINPDGISYINQAKAISAGNWELARNCGYDFISVYHLLIVAVYRISGEWIFSAKSISLFFGTAAIIPFYLLMKQLFRRAVAVIAGLAFSIHPFFVANSVELIKDPIFWFTSLLGMLFFTIAVKRDDKSYFLLFSAISFLLAGLTRIEIVVYFAGTIIYIVLCENNKKRKLFLFCLPVFVLFCLVVISDFFLFKYNAYFWNFYLLPRGRHFFSIFSVNQLGASGLKKAFIVLQVLISKLITAVSLPLLPLFMVGFSTVKSEIKREKLFWYFIIIAFLSLATICFFYLKTGIMSPRYTVLAIFPGFVFMCFGTEKVLHFLEHKGLQVKTAVLLIFLYIIIATSFSHSLFHNKTGKVVYRAIGEYIANAEKNRNTVVMSSDSRAMFYANLNTRGTECSNQSLYYKSLIKMQYQEMVLFLKNNRVDYFVWEEKIWEHAGYDFLRTVRPENLKEIVRWDSKQGQLIVFKVLP